ncbi:hypothetical protein SAMN03159423_4831 [Bradyrhizobium sp. NFR13]|uniref:hypothetical protein n=1 Tax=Bradyrhizobium sp. NFR13 TaxID=1566285 RepID=UPI0008F14B00|nr:hypothetical protein [Bradyrhizobium sp. NFR13]SFM00153.1 hypothetical protein SAMN03159423_4831 [Bradyrhizobium sp. NFR13]
MNVKWTEDQDALARRLFQIEASEETFREQLGRTKRAARLRLRYLDDAGFRLAAKERKATARYAAPKKIVSIASRPQPSGDQLETALHRNYAPRSVTASLLGDPAPGQSALDRRNTAEARL